MNHFLVVCVLSAMFSLPLGCTNRSETKPTSSQQGIETNSQSVRSDSYVSPPKEKKLIKKKPKIVDKPKIAGEKVIVQDTRISINSVREVDEIIVSEDGEIIKKSKGKVVLHDKPESIAKPNPHLKKSAIETLLKYRGPSYEKKQIKGGDVYSVHAATESNYKKIDILLSALKIPFVIHVSGGELGNGFRDAGVLFVIVDSQNYDKVVKLLNASVKYGFLTHFPIHKLRLLPVEEKK